MNSVVLDASAVLAVINSEPGADVVVASLDNASLSTVNRAEVISKLVERGVAIGAAKAALFKIGVRVVDFDITLSDRAGELRVLTKSQGLSLADRACIALAEREGAVALTADRTWAALDLRTEVRLIR